MDYWGDVLYGPRHVGFWGGNREGERERKQGYCIQQATVRRLKRRRGIEDSLNDEYQNKCITMLFFFAFHLSANSQGVTQGICWLYLGMQLLRVRRVTIYWMVFVVMSKEEGSMYSERLYISIILGRISTSSNSVESFNTSKNRKIKLYAITLIR